MGERLGGWVRRMGRELVRGATLIGASMFCGGEIAPLLGRGEPRSGEHVVPPPRLSESELHREAMAGLQAIERYLATDEHLRP